MKYNTLGKTGLQVSAIGFGCSSLGGMFGDVHESVGVRAVHRALELGINYFDVAPYYGLGKAEKVLGKALQSAEVPRNRYYVATKVGRYGQNDFDFSADRICKSVDESLQRLQLEYIDIIQVHDMEFGSLDQIVEETLPALARLKEIGKVHFIGITGLPLNIFKYVLEKDVHDVVDVVLSYSHYCLANDALESSSLLRELREYKTTKWRTQGISNDEHTSRLGIVNAAVLSMGLLTSKGPPEWHPASLEIKRACKRAARLCDERKVPIEKVAIQYALANQDIDITLVGIANVRELELAVKWYQELLRNESDTELLENVLQVLHPVRNQMWPSGRMEN